MHSSVIRSETVYFEPSLYFPVPSVVIVIVVVVKAAEEALNVLALVSPGPVRGAYCCPST